MSAPNANVGDDDHDASESGMMPIATGLAEASEVDDPQVRSRRTALATRLLESPAQTAMLDRFSWVLRLIARLLFAHVLFEKRAIDNLHDADERGAVVYVMQSRSLLDYLYFNWAFQEHGIRIARFSNGPRTHWLRGFFSWLASFVRRNPTEKPEEQFQALVANDEPVFVFLQQPTATAERNVEYSQKYLYRLIRAQKTSSQEIFVVPLMIVWERRPDAKHATIVEEIFGTVQSPGSFRKFIYWFQTIWQSFLRFGQPIAQVSSKISLLEFLEEYPDADSADASELLRERLVEGVEQDRHVILGPQSEPPATLWKSVSQQPALLDVVRTVAAADGVSEEDVLARSRRQFDEIAAEPSLLAMKVLSSILSLLWYRIYDGFEVDEPGLERVREAARDSAIVLIPSHKSHIDYLIISYLFYHYGLMIPMVAAGVNLNFWPLGPLFRRAGAFFIRRSFKGDPLYPVVFREYLTKIMEEGYPIEFFIEGTRSRTGKLIKPKYGMLEMIVRSFASGRLDSIKLVPISVGYEKIIEEGAYQSELLGGEKEKESLGGLLKTPKFLTSKYGRLYIEFDEPIDLGEYLTKYELDHISPAESGEHDDAMEALVVRLGHRIIYDINRVTTVTPTALCAMVFLTNEARGIDRYRFLGEVGFLLRFLTEDQRDVRLSRTLRDALETRAGSIQRLETADARRKENADVSHSTERNFAIESVMGNAVSHVVDEALELFIESDQVKVRDTDGERFYTVPEGERHKLSYYRNTIVHHFVPEALLASAIARFRSKRIQLSELMRETLFLSKLFKYEWIYEERAEFRNVFMRTLRYFETSGWVELQGETVRPVDDTEGPVGQVVRVTDPLPVELQFFRRQVLSFIEAYTIVAGAVHALAQNEVEEGELLKSILKGARLDYAGGGILFWESLSKPTYTNALRLLDDWNVVDRHWNEAKKKTMYRLTATSPDATHANLVERLRGFAYPERNPAPDDSAELSEPAVPALTETRSEDTVNDD